MNILKTLRRPYSSIIMASAFLFVSCDGNEVIQEPDLQIQKEFKTTSLQSSKLSNDMNDFFNSKYAKKNIDNSSFDFDNVYEVENTITGEISYMINSNNDEKTKLGVYPKDNDEYVFLIVEYINNGDDKEILYKNISGEIVIIVSVNTTTEKVSVFNPYGTTTSNLVTLDCGQLVADCLSDAYTNRGWTSVGLWVVTGFYPAFGIGAAAGCAAALCVE